MKNMKVSQWPIGERPCDILLIKHAIGLDRFKEERFRFWSAM